MITIFIIIIIFIIINIIIVTITIIIIIIIITIKTIITDVISSSPFSSASRSLSSQKSISIVNWTLQREQFALISWFISMSANLKYYCYLVVIVVAVDIVDFTLLMIMLLLFCCFFRGFFVLIFFTTNVCDTKSSRQISTRILCVNLLNLKT